MYCKNCGNKLENQDWFCRKCGKKNEESDKDRITNETFKTTANMNVSTTSGRTGSTYAKVCSVFSCVLFVILAFKYVDIAKVCQQDSFYAFEFIVYDNPEIAKVIYWIFCIYILTECIMSIILMMKNKNGKTLVTRGSSCLGLMFLRNCLGTLNFCAIWRNQINFISSILSAFGDKSFRFSCDF